LGVITVITYFTSGTPKIVMSGALINLVVLIWALGRAVLTYWGVVLIALLRDLIILPNPTLIVPVAWSTNKVRGSATILDWVLITWTRSLARCTEVVRIKETSLNKIFPRRTGA
jgi:hypothetical protein